MARRCSSQAELWLLTVAAILALAIAACGGDPVTSSGGEQARPTQGDGVGDDWATVDWRHGMIVAKGDAGFSALFAEEKGFFEKYGLRVHIAQFEGSSQLTQAMLAGELDTAENNADPVLQAVAAGGDVRAIGSTLAGVAYNIYSQTEIETLADLKGKTLGVSRPGAFPDLVTRAMMIQQGVDPEGVKIVNAGNDVTRYGALVAGKIDATAASAEFEPQADDDGVRILARASEILPQWPRFIVWGNPASLEANGEAAARFLAAMIESLRYALDNPEETVAFTAGVLGLEPDDPRLSFTYELQAPLVAPNAEVPIDKLEFVADFLEDAGQIDNAIDIDAVVDTSYQQRAVDLVDAS